MHGGAGMKISKDKIILAVFFVLFLALNAYLVFIHEPWRDEIHAWLITREMSIPEMILFSRQETHPILWNLVLLPFAKSGAPVWTMNALSYVIVAVSAWLFLFKTKLTDIVKIVILFTVPFVYTYSSIARNYCLILLLGMLICVLYDRRYKQPLIYSILISLLVFTHALAWGLVAGLTISFHIKEIFAGIFRKSDMNKKSFIRMTAGFALIAISSVTAVLTLYGSKNTGLIVSEDKYTDKVVIMMLIQLVLVLALTILSKGKLWKEAVIIGTTFVFMIAVYKLVYSAVFYQRLILITVFMLFFMLCALGGNKSLSKLVKTGVYVLFAVSVIITGSAVSTFNAVTDDIIFNYSSAKEMAEYLNGNLQNEDVILVDTGVFAQTIIPYTDKTLYDIRYKANIVDSLYHVHNEDEVIACILDIKNHEEYKGKYLISIYKIKGNKEIYVTPDSIMGETYHLYYIPE